MILWGVMGWQVNRERVFSLKCSFTIVETFPQFLDPLVVVFLFFSLPSETRLYTDVEREREREREKRRCGSTIEERFTIGSII